MGVSRRYGGTDGNSEMPLTSVMCDDLCQQGGLSAAGRVTSTLPKKIRICVQTQSPVSSKHPKLRPHYVKS